MIYSRELTFNISLAEPEADGENDDETLGDEHSEPLDTSDYTYTGGTGTPIGTKPGATEANGEAAATTQHENLNWSESAGKGGKRKGNNGNTLDTNLGTNTTADGDVATPTTSKGGKAAGGGRKSGKGGKGGN